LQIPCYKPFIFGNDVGSIPTVSTSTHRWNFVMSSADYVIGCDPYDKLSWWQNLLKKIGFYNNRPKVGVAIFKKNNDGTTEFVKHCS
jgi:type I restriction-modification system DNA methylase subunit